MAELNQFNIDNIDPILMTGGQFVLWGNVLHGKSIHMCIEQNNNQATLCCRTSPNSNDVLISFPVNSISDMSQGRVSTEFKLIKTISNDCCMTITSKSTSTVLNIQASSKKNRDVWWNALVNAVKVSGKTVRNNSNKQSIQSHQVSTSAQHKTSSQQSIDNTNELINKMKSGALFYKYDIVNTTCVRSEIYVYTSGVGRQGALMWCTVTTGCISQLSAVHNDTLQQYYKQYKQRTSDGSINFSQLSDMLLRKRTSTLQQATDAHDECCMSLVTAKYTLNIEALNRAQLLEWKEGLISTIAASGRQMLRSIPNSDSNNKLSSSQSARTVSTPNLHTPATTNVHARSANNSATSSPRSQHRRTVSSSGKSDDPVTLVKSSSTPNNIAQQKQHTNGELTLDQLNTTLTTGQIFTLYYTNSRTSTVDNHQVYVHIKLQPVFRLYWSSPKNRTENERQSVLLSKVIELTTGKSSPSLKHQNVLDEHCLVIITPNGTLSLVAPNTQCRKTWLLGLHQLLISDGKKLLTNDTPIKQLNKSIASAGCSNNTVSSVPVSAAVPASNDRAARVCSQLTGAATNATIYDTSADSKSCVPVRVNMCIIPDSGEFAPAYITWSAAITSRDNNRSTSNSSSDKFVLKQLAEMSAGSDADLLKLDAAQHLRHNTELHNTLLSLRSTSGKYMHVAFQSSAIRELWMNCVHELMCIHIQPNNDIQKTTHKPSLSNSDPAKLRSMSTNAQSNAIDCSIMIKGQVFTIHTSTTNDVYFFFYSPSDIDTTQSILYWCEPGERKQIIKQSIRISNITNVEMGGNDVDSKQIAVSDRSFTIATDSSRLYLEAFSVAVRDKWCSILQSIINPDNTTYQSRGHNAPPHTTLSISTNDERNIRNTAIISPSIKSPQQSTLALNILQTGQTFNMYYINSSTNNYAVQSVQLWFVPQNNDDSPGCLYWCASNTNRVHQYDSSLHLSTVRMLYAGKTTATLQSELAAAADDDCCMTIASDSVALDLEANTPYARETFIRALHYLLTRSGMRAVESSTADDGTITRDASNSISQASSISNNQPAFGLNERVDNNNSLSNDVNRSHTRTALNRTINFSDPTDKLSLEVKIGEGSYGSVWRAVDIRDNSLVAVKILQDLSDMQPLRKEIKILRSCQNQYIVGYKGAYQRRQSLWIVMEYCAGGSLGDLMQLADRCLSEREIAAVMKMSLLGLSYLHGTGRIHRDIKACNLLLSHTGMIKLADFGVSGQLDRTLGRKLTVIGTPHWMAPEVLLSDEYDCKADVWSLGITAYELCVGEPPHANLHSMRAALKIPITSPPTLPQPHRYTQLFHSFIQACLVKEPDKRPTAEQLLQHPFILDAPSHQQLRPLVDIAIQANNVKANQQQAQLLPSSQSTVSSQQSNQQRCNDTLLSQNGMTRSKPNGINASRSRLIDNNFDENSTDDDNFTTQQTFIQHSQPNQCINSLYRYSIGLLGNNHSNDL